MNEEEKFIYIIFPITFLIYSSIRLFPKTRNKKIIMHLGFYLGLISIIVSLFETKMKFFELNIIYFIFSAPIAFLLYIISLFIVGTKLNKSNLLLFDVMKLKSKLKKSYTKESLNNIKTSIYEELLYRSSIQYAIFQLTSNIWLTIIISSVYFTLIHYKKSIALVQMIDIFIFSILITIVFQTSNNIIFVIFIHILRNSLVISQKYVFAFKIQKKIALISENIKGET